MEQLKPCPFCGAEPKLHVCDGAGMYHTDDLNAKVLFGRAMSCKMIVCPKCWIKTKAYKTDRGVFNAWNRRADNG